MYIERPGPIRSNTRRHYHDYPYRPARQEREEREPSPRAVRLVRGILLLVLVIVLLVVLILGLLGVAIVNQARQDEAAPAEAIVVLGTAQWAGYPSVTFRARLDHAYNLYTEGYADLIVLTGGTAPGDTLSEAEVGANYLRTFGVPEEHLLTVPEGLNSRQSLEHASSALLQREREEVILVSDAFHMFRVKRIASDFGLDPLGSPTTTSPIRPGSPAEQRYVVREVFAYVNYLFFDS